MKQVFIIILFACLLSCTKNKEDLPFPWVEEGNALTYDYFSLADTTYEALMLRVIINPGNTNLRFRFEYPNWNSVSGAKSVGVGYNVYRKQDGIYTSKYVECGLGSGWGSSFHYIRIPASPKLNENYPDYLCQSRVYSAFKAIELEKFINVKAGYFKTYILQDTLSGRKEYWSEEHGLIKMDLFDSNENLSGTYELAAKNY